MAEKTLQTRIQLKYDSYANWIKTDIEGKGANLILKKGEIAFCEIPMGNSEATTAPTILFKVGDGVTPFGALNWASAKAADVYDWAKETGLNITAEGTGNVIGSMEWDASLNNGKGGIKYTKVNVATTDNIEALEATLAAMSAKINAMYSNEDIDNAINVVKEEALNSINAAKEAVIAAAAEDATAKANAAKEAAITTATEDAEAKIAAAKASVIADAAEKYQPKGDYLTEITTTENNGLKVTNNNQIDIDTNIVFVFDCGSSSENV